MVPVAAVRAWSLLAVAQAQGDASGELDAAMERVGPFEATPA